MFIERTSYKYCVCLPVIATSYNFIISLLRSQLWSVIREFPSSVAFFSPQSLYGQDGARRSNDRYSSDFVAVKALRVACGRGYLINHIHEFFTYLFSQIASHLIAHNKITQNPYSDGHHFAIFSDFCFKLHFSLLYLAGTGRKSLCCGIL